MRVKKESLEWDIHCINGNYNRNFTLHKDCNGYYVMENHRCVSEALTGGECKALLTGIVFVLKK